MGYTISALAAPPECDQVLAYLSDEARMLVQRRDSVFYQLTNASTVAAEQQAELTVLNTDISYLTPLVPTLPASKKRTERENELRRSIDRRDELVARQNEKGAVSLVLRQLELAQLEARLAEVTALQTAVLARKAELEA